MECLATVGCGGQVPEGRWTWGRKGVRSRSPQAMWRVHGPGCGGYAEPRRWKPHGGFRLAKWRGTRASALFQAVPWIQGRGGGRIPCRSCAAVRLRDWQQRAWQGRRGAGKAKGHREGGLLEFGAGEESRTPDLRITNALLYQLSYTGLVLSL